MEPNVKPEEVVRETFLEELRKAILQWVADDSDWKLPRGALRIGKKPTTVQTRFDMSVWRHFVVVTLEGVEYQLGDLKELVNQVACRISTTPGAIDASRRDKLEGLIRAAQSGRRQSSFLDRELCRVAAKGFLQQPIIQELVRSGG